MSSQEHPSDSLHAPSGDPSPPASNVHLFGGDVAGAPAAFRWRVGIPVALVILVLIVFVPALAAGFVHWDDDNLLLSTTSYQGVSAQSLKWMWTTSYAGHFQPLTWLSYSLDHYWAHYDAFGYHLTNVVLHLIGAVLFYFVCLRLLRCGAPARWHPSSKAMYLGAGFAAALFAIHPLRAESVAWVAERRDVLSGVFYMAALWFYIAYASPPSPAPLEGDVQALGGSRSSGRLPYVAAFLCFVLSLLAKASAVMLPAVLLVLDVYPLRRVQATNRPRRTMWAYLLLEKVPFLLVAGAIAVRAVEAQRAAGAFYPLAEYDLPSRLAQSCYGAAFYIWKTVLPIGLGPLYPIPHRDVLFGAMLWSGVATLVVLAGVALWLRRRVPAVLAVLLVYLIQLFPVLGLFQSGPQLVADRYSYLACLGFAVLGGAGLVWLLSGRRYRSHGNVRAVTVMAISLMLAGLAHGTFAQCGYWDEPLDLWWRGVRVAPNSSVAHVNFADALAEVGEVRLAMEHYDRALRIEPRDPIAASHFARVLRRTGDLEKAAELFAMTVRLDPERALDRERLAETLVDLGRPSDAVTILRARALRAPYDLVIVEMLADLLATYPDAAVRNGPEAVRWATHVHRARGGRNPATMLVLASALAEDGQFQRAADVGNNALAAAQDARNERLAQELQRRIALFDAQRPYHYGD